ELLAVLGRAGRRRRRPRRLRRLPGPGPGQAALRRRGQAGGRLGHRPGVRRRAGRCSRMAGRGRARRPCVAGRPRVGAGRAPYLPAGGHRTGLRGDVLGGAGAAPGRDVGRAEPHLAAAPASPCCPPRALPPSVAGTGGGPAPARPVRRPRRGRGAGRRPLRRRRLPGGAALAGPDGRPGRRERVVGADGARGRHGPGDARAGRARLRVAAGPGAARGERPLAL
ncbi:MAG: hypothetical protein AVDCRST_MAG32-2487, partial [uncultured Nocardioides sp.]